MNYNHEYLVKVLSETSKRHPPIRDHVWCGVIDLDNEQCDELTPRYISNNMFPNSKPEIGKVYNQSFKKTDNGIECVMEEIVQ